jgi:hypothetical protein
MQQRDERRAPRQYRDKTEHDGEHNRRDGAFKQ